MPTKHGLIIVNAYRLPAGVEDQVRRLCEAFARRHIPLDVRKNNELSAWIDQASVVGALPAYDFIIYLDKDKYIARMLETLGYRLFNRAQAIEVCDDKMLTHLALAGHGIMMPKTISAPLCFEDDANRAFLADVEKQLSFPLVAKECFGSQGKQVSLVSDHDALLACENRLLKVPHLYQALVASSYGFDYRLIVIGGQMVSAIKRQSDGGFIANIAAGGHGQKVSLDPRYRAMAEKAAKILGLDYCGVDLLQGPSGEPILCEVNSNAFFRETEKITGLDIAEAYARHIEAQIDKTL